MRVLVLGSGQIATAVCKAAPQACEILTRSHAQLDITDSSAVTRAVSEIKPDWIINGAAYTAVDRAEDERAMASAVNDAAVGSIAEAAALAGSRLLHLSTDFVFDGTRGCAYSPSDATNPLSVYGATKLAGERHVRAHRTGIVLRTSWVYASIGKNFVLTMLKLMRERESIDVVCDQIGTPTSAASTADAIWRLVESAPQGGVYHWADLGVASWYDFAIAIKEEAIERALITRPVAIVPIASAFYPTRAKRPSFSVLDTTATRSMLGVSGRHWRQNLRTVLDEIRAA